MSLSVHTGMPGVGAFLARNQPAAAPDAVAVVAIRAVIRIRAHEQLSLSLERRRDAGLPSFHTGRSAFTSFPAMSHPSLQRPLSPMFLPGAGAERHA